MSPAARALGVVGGGETDRCLAGLHGLGDGVETRRPHLRPEAERREVGERFGSRSGRVLQRQHRLRDGVIGRTEIDRLAPGVDDRELVDGEIEVLRTGCQRVVEPDGLELHLVRTVSQLPDHFPGDGAS